MKAGAGGRDRYRNDPDDRPTSDLRADTLYQAANREAGLADFADFLWELAAAAEAGSDHQLAFTKLFLSIARTDAAVGQRRDTAER